jgi:micrococcal nuclease
VARVADGDTIVLADGRRVRLVQVDAPELFGECYGEAARLTLLHLLPPGSPVRLTRDPALDDRDEHGRLLRYIDAGGRNVNLELVGRGAAAPYFYRRARGRHADALERAAEEALAARRGLWRACPQARLRPIRALSTGPAPG